MKMKILLLILGITLLIGIAIAGTTISKEIPIDKSLSTWATANDKTDFSYSERVYDNGDIRVCVLSTGRIISCKIIADARQVDATEKALLENYLSYLKTETEKSQKRIINEGNGTIAIKGA